LNPTYEIISVDANSLNQHGFFCYMSKPKSPGYRQKYAWLEQRFAEGMRIHIVHEHGGRNVGFIEYIPGEYAWRVLDAPGYLVIHCLWVVGKGKGYGSRLIQICVDEACGLGKRGVAMVASEGVWLAGKQIFLDNGFEQVDQSGPSFSLLVHRLEDGPDPVFPKDWEARQAAYGDGLTVVRTPQCPYIEDACRYVLDFAQARGIPGKVVELSTAQEVQTRAPSPYGVFSIVYNQRLLSYYYLLPKDLEKIIPAP
jgi:GNAT superfamily N-acetyltransferase